MVTVVMPLFNAREYVAAAIESVRRDEAVTEILVVDDASTDGSADAVAALDDPRIRLLCNDRNVGAARSRHVAVLAATNDLLCFLDADDHLADDAVSLAVGAMRDRDLSMSLFRMLQTDQDGTGARTYIDPPASDISGVDAFRLTLGAWHIHPMGVVRRSVYLAAIERMQFHGYSDDELLTRHLFLAAEKVGGNRGRYYYRMVAKTRGANHHAGQGRTALEVLRLAHAELDDAETDPAVRNARNHVCTLLLGMAVRGMWDPVCGAAASVLRAELSAMPGCWRVADGPSALMLGVASLLLRVRRR